jgi:hypothetical protein
MQDLFDPGSGNTVKFAKYTFLVAGIYGILALAPQYFLLERNSSDFPPPITHLEYYYGFIGIALVFQIIFLMISANPVKYRPLVGVSILEKLSFAIPVAILFFQNKVSSAIFAAGMIDLFLGMFFLISFLKIRARGNSELASEYIN